MKKVTFQLMMMKQLQKNGNHIPWVLDSSIYLQEDEETTKLATLLIFMALKSNFWKRIEAKCWTEGYLHLLMTISFKNWRTLKILSSGLVKTVYTLAYGVMLRDIKVKRSS